MGGTIKSMKLYWQVERIETELRALGFAENDELTVEDLLPFDQYHYRGTAAVEEALAVLKPGPADQVLDVGAGIGGPARYMALTAGCHVTALELQPDLNETGARLTARCGLAGRVEHLCGDILSGIVAERGYDALVSMLCFLHIPDRETLFEQCRAALKPGGRLFIEDYYARGSLTEEERRNLAEKVYCNYLPSLEDYQAQLSAAGFADIELLDLTADWSDFVAERLSAFRAARERHTTLHGTELVEGLDDFYATVSTIFAGGRLGGARIVARRP